MNSSRSAAGAAGRGPRRVTPARVGAAGAAKAAKKVGVRAGRMDLIFLVLVLSLLTIGLIMLFSASYASAYYYQNNSFYYISRQVVFAIIGVAAMFILAFIDYHLFQKFSMLIMAGAIFLLILVRLLPENKGGFHRWIDVFGMFTIQPSEIAKFAVVILFSHMISTNYKRIKSFRYGILPYVAILGVICILLVLQPHLSAIILTISLGAVVMLVGGVDIKWFVLAGVLALVFVGFAIMIPGVVSYAQSRLQFWLDPWADRQGKGFQTIQSLYAIGSGGLLGVGIGNSRQKYLYLPEVQNDFVFAIVGEELGFVGATLIIILFALLVWRGFIIAARAKDRFGMLIAVGLTAQVGLQAFLNIAVVTNTIPNTGISLPFFSYGGTALMMLLGQMGVVLSVSRQSAVIKE